MKWENRHILSASWTRVAHDVEQAFFRIEREKRFLSALINDCIAGAAVALIAWLVRSLQEGDLLLFACLGSSAAFVVFDRWRRTTALVRSLELT